MIANCARFAVYVSLLVAGSGLVGCRSAAVSERVSGDVQTLTVTSPRSGGSGSLRAALQRAGDHSGATRIVFDQVRFAEPARIELRKPLPSIRTHVEIDGYIADRLWQPSGVTLGGASAGQILLVEPAGKLTLRYLTLADGNAPQGGAVLNEGELLIDSVLLIDNRAEIAGGAIFGRGVTRIVNSTFYRNRAPDGSAVASEGGTLELLHVTAAENAGATAVAARSAKLRMFNSVLRNEGAADCVSDTDAITAFNAMRRSDGCGTSLPDLNPTFEKLGYYNGPTQTLPVRVRGGGINRGSAAVPTTLPYPDWDQRGGGDPRRVAGVPDLGAVERQGQTRLEVDTASDDDLRICSPHAVNDCSLRGALTLAAAMSDADAIRLDVPPDTRIRVLSPLPTPQRTIHVTSLARVTIHARASDVAQLTFDDTVTVTTD